MGEKMDDLAYLCFDSTCLIFFERLLWLLLAIYHGTLTIFFISRRHTHGRYALCMLMGQLTGWWCYVRYDGAGFEFDVAIQGP